METRTYNFGQIQISYDLSKLADPASVFFLDIETTGFSPKSAFIYLIGGAFYKEENWCGIQWFATSPAEEKDILAAFSFFVSNYPTLIHFNGNQFDLPFLKARMELHGISCNFDGFAGIDIYKRISACKYFLRLPNCRQKSLEEFLNIHREDRYDGGQLIAIYKKYVREKEPEQLRLLLLHNQEDLCGMLQILPMLAYVDIFSHKLQITKAQTSRYEDMDGQPQKELLLSLRLPSPLPVPVSFHESDCYFTAEGENAVLRIPVYREELKYFYANYKDYYYLPLEDTAMHKSVASFVDKNHRIQATAKNCYTRKLSSYLPQWDFLFTPFFKREYDSSLLFFELTEELKKDREAFAQYASHVLDMLLSVKL